MNHLDQLSLSLLADDMLPKKTAESFHRHIASCPQCERAYDDIQAMSFAMAKFPPVTPPQGFESLRQGILDNLPEQDPTSSDNVVEIIEHHTKVNPWASVDFKQIAMYGAVAVLAFGFFSSPSQDMASSTSSSMGSAEVAVESAISPRSEGDVSSVMMDTEDQDAIGGVEDMESQAVSSGLREQLDAQVCENSYVSTWEEMSGATVKAMEEISSFNDQVVEFTFLLNELPEDLDRTLFEDTLVEGYGIANLSASQVPPSLGELTKIFQAYPEVRYVQVVIFSDTYDLTHTPTLWGTEGG